MSSGKHFGILILSTPCVFLTDGNNRILPSTLILVMMALEVIEWAKVY